MGRWLRVVRDVPPEPVAGVGAALSGLTLVGAFTASLASGAVRGASLAAAGVLLLLVATGVSLYAWRLGVPGRSD